MVKSDLKYEYSWLVCDENAPRILGFPNDLILNLKDGNEVLDFINRFMSAHGLKSVDSGSHVEKMISTRMPADIKTHKDIYEWILGNWANYY